MQIIGVGSSGMRITNHLLSKSPISTNVGMVTSDKYILSYSVAESKLFLQPEFRGLGDSANIETARMLIDSSKENIVRFINSATVILTAGMGGQSSYTLPFIAQITKEIGIRTIGVISTPFTFEGRRQCVRANEGLRLTQESIPVLSVLNADETLRGTSNETSLTNAFSALNEWMSEIVLFYSKLFQEPDR
ncbi:MAG: hypothetical protein LBS35_09655 [Synergistaceae bacterium]|nr:hypothetical protein [Synergistaceae bacterium]